MATPDTTETRPVEPRRLWFGLATPAVAWVTLGIADLVIEWRMCMRYGSPLAAGGNAVGRGLCIGLSVVLLSVGIMAGVISYRNWRRLSREQKLLNALGTDRREFMALMGLFVSLTLGMGMFWLLLTPFIITACERAK